MDEGRVSGIRFLEDAVHRHFIAEMKEIAEDPDLEERAKPHQRRLTRQDWREAKELIKELSRGCA